MSIFILLPMNLVKALPLIDVNLPQFISWTLNCFLVLLDFLLALFCWTAFFKFNFAQIYFSVRRSPVDTTSPLDAPSETLNQLTCHHRAVELTCVRLHLSLKALCSDWVWILQNISLVQNMQSNIWLLWSHQLGFYNFLEKNELLIPSLPPPRASSPVQALLSAPFTAPGDMVAA